MVVVMKGDRYMPCFDLGLDVYEEIVSFTGYPWNFTVTAPVGKQFVSASWKACTTSMSADDCNSNAVADYTVSHCPSDDLNEWNFKVLQNGGGATMSKMRIKMVTIDA